MKKYLWKVVLFYIFANFKKICGFKMIAEFLYLLLHWMGGIMSFCLKPIKTALHTYVTGKGRSLWVPGSVLATWAPQTILWELLLLNDHNTLSMMVSWWHLLKAYSLKVYGAGPDRRGFRAKDKLCLGSPGWLGGKYQEWSGVSPRVRCDGRLCKVISGVEMKWGVSRAGV